MDKSVEEFRMRRDARLKKRLDEFKEGDHPRDENGRFTSGGGGGNSKESRIKEITRGRTYEQLGRRELVKIAKVHGMDTAKYNKESGKPVVPNADIVKDIRAFEKKSK